MKYITNNTFWKEDTNTLSVNKNFSEVQIMADDLQLLYEIVGNMVKNFSMLIWR